MRICHSYLAARRSLLGVAIAMVILNITGCGASDEGDKFKGDRGTVSGKVTYKGQPVPAKSTVQFQSKTGGYSAAGTINDKGEYTLTYNGPKGQNLPAVEYGVQIGPPPVAQPEMNMTDPSKTPAAPPPPFPAKYFSPTTSGLNYTVKAGANKADFDLPD